ncbi:hypothetical protein MXD62_37445 [Frankia sp. Mgl5]|uniref:hypothetical protein n=1 Tax=Frankia sp. Mgl5 TaxID=2933793 RepID=UPI00200D66EF|nr:hypothetical protein [Frankia sp. Mgl5]MCK9932761.1 hypothetical protein [Frankia sp. Mgl5]
MARLRVEAVGVFGIALGGMLMHTVPMPSAWVWLVAMIFVVVLGVNITAWLVVPRVIGSVVASIRPLPAGGGSFDRDRDAEWSSSSEWQPEAWSSSWDYAGGDGPDAGDGDGDGADEDWSVGRPGSGQGRRRVRGHDGSSSTGGASYGFGVSSW